MKEYFNYIWSFRFFRWVIYLNLLIHLYSFVEFNQQRYAELVESKYLCGLSLNQDQNSDWGLDLFSNSSKILPSKLKNKKQLVVVTKAVLQAFKTTNSFTANTSSVIELRAHLNIRLRAPPIS